jgi:hypothetical protein
MKERLNLTIDGALLEAMKVYAAGKGISVSELVESYFRQVTRPVSRHNILDMVDQMGGPDSMGSGDVRSSGAAGGSKSVEGVGIVADDGVGGIGNDKEVKYGL